MLTAAYAAFAIAELVLGVWGFVLFARRRTLGSFTMALPILLLVWDNAIVVLGASIGPGALLETLSWPRFAGHALLTPIWIVTAFEYARDVGAPRLQGTWSRVAEWGLYAAMAAYGVVRSLVLLEFELVRQADIVYYTNGGGFPGPPLPAIVMVVTVIACGAVLWRRASWPWLALGGVVMFVAAAIPTSAVGFWVSNTGEVVLSLAFVLTERHLQSIGIAPRDSGGV